MEAYVHLLHIITCAHISPEALITIDVSTHWTRVSVVCRTKKGWYRPLGRLISPHLLCATVRVNACMEERSNDPSVRPSRGIVCRRINPIIINGIEKKDAAHWRKSCGKAYLIIGHSKFQFHTLYSIVYFSSCSNWKTVIRFNHPKKGCEHCRTNLRSRNWTP